jgi:hypothetical protein
VLAGRADLHLEVAHHHLDAAGAAGDRVVAVAPLLLGKGAQAVGDLGTSLVADGLRLRNQTVHRLGRTRSSPGT